MDAGIPSGARIAIAVVLGVGLLIFLLWRAAKGSQAKQMTMLETLGLRVTSTTPLLRAEGVCLGLPTQLEEVVHQHRHGSSHSTRIVMTGSGTAEAALVSARPSPVASGEPAAMRQVPTGDPSFDGHFRAFANDEQGAALWRDPNLRARVLALGTRGLMGELIELYLARGQVRIVLGFSGLGEDKVRGALELGAALLGASQPQGWSAPQRW